MKSIDRIITALERIAAALEQNGSGQPRPEALTIEAAAKFLSLKPEQIQHLIRIRRLEYTAVGSQRGRVIPIASLRKFLDDYRQAALNLPKRAHNGKNGKH